MEHDLAKEINLAISTAKFSKHGINELCNFLLFYENPLEIVFSDSMKNKVSLGRGILNLSGVDDYHNPYNVYFIRDSNYVFVIKNNRVCYGDIPSHHYLKTSRDQTCFNHPIYIVDFPINTQLFKSFHNEIALKEYSKWVLNESPWADAFLIKDEEKIYETGQRFDLNFPANYLLQAMSAYRKMREYRMLVELWYAGVDKGVNPVAALVTSYYINNGEGIVGNFRNMSELEFFVTGRSALSAHGIMEFSSLDVEGYFNLKNNVRTNFKDFPPFYSSPVAKLTRHIWQSKEHRNNNKYYAIMDQGKRLNPYSISKRRFKLNEVPEVMLEMEATSFLIRNGA